MTGLQEVKLKHEAEAQQRLQEQLDKVKFRIKCIDVELHTEVRHVTTAQCCLANPQGCDAVLTDLTCVLSPCVHAGAKLGWEQQ